MNNLNSVLLEGKIYVDCDFYKRNTFGLVSKRFFKEDGKLQEEQFYIDIYINDKISTQCKIGREVRIVGRLKNVEKPAGIQSVAIEAEHIEFR